jgi:hypothetical protein
MSPEQGAAPVDSEPRVRPQLPDNPSRPDSLKKALAMAKGSVSHFHRKERYSPHIIEIVQIMGELEGGSYLLTPNEAFALDKMPERQLVVSFTETYGYESETYLYKLVQLIACERSIRGIIEGPPVGTVLKKAKPTPDNIALKGCVLEAEQEIAEKIFGEDASKQLRKLRETFFWHRNGNVHKNKSGRYTHDQYTRDKMLTDLIARYEIRRYHLIEGSALVSQGQSE